MDSMIKLLGELMIIVVEAGRFLSSKILYWSLRVLNKVIRNSYVGAYL